MLVACAVLSAGAYFHFGHLPAGFVHRWEMFHYFVGSKYHTELGYERLYQCVAVADVEDGVRWSERRQVRDLVSDDPWTEGWDERSDVQSPADADGNADGWADRDF